jgi:hypothetical protein
MSEVTSSEVRLYIVPSVVCILWENDRPNKQHVYHKLYFKSGKTATETYKMLKHTFKFKSEVVSVNDANHSWHQFMSKSHEYVA